MKITKTGKRGGVVPRDVRVVEKQVPKTLVWLVALWAALTLGLMAGGCASNPPGGPADAQTLLECQQLLKECSESLIDCESM